MRPNVTLFLVVIAAFTWGCGGADVFGGSHEQPPTAFIVDQSKAVLPTDVTLHAALEAETIEKIRARLPHDVLAAFEETLADPLAGRIWRVRGDEEMSRLLSTLYALQDARRYQVEQRESRRAATLRSVAVEIMLVESFDREDIFARVARTPGPQGRNTVHITPDGLTPERVALALEAISRMRRSDGDFPLAQRVALLRNNVRLRPEGSVHLSRAAEVVRRIKSAERQTPRGEARGVRIIITLPPESQ